MGETRGTVDGRCLCGAVKFSAFLAKRTVDICHCRMCRRWASGPYIGLSHEGEVSFEGEENITRYLSSEWGECVFCKLCGSHLYWHLLGSNHYAFSAGALEDQDRLNLSMQIFIDEKPDYYEFANDTPKLTGEETVAAFIGANKVTE